MPPTKRPRIRHSASTPSLPERLPFITDEEQMQSKNIIKQMRGDQQELKKQAGQVIAATHRILAACEQKIGIHQMELQTHQAVGCIV